MIFVHFFVSQTIYLADETIFYFFTKSQHSFVDFNLVFDNVLASIMESIREVFVTKRLIVTYGTRVYGSGFKIAFRISAR